MTDSILSGSTDSADGGAKKNETQAPAKPWHAASLSLWNAIRRIVGQTNPDGDQLAERLVGASPVDRRMLAFDDEGQRALGALTPARRHLEEWGAKGALMAHGYASGGSEHVVEARHWATHRPDYETSAMRSDKVAPILSVTVEASYIDRLCELLTAPTLEKPEIARQTERRVTAQAESIKNAFVALYKGNLPSRGELSDQQLATDVQLYCKQNKLINPSCDTVLREAGRKRRARRKDSNGI